MLDDRLAEHVPGCNMAFRRETLLKLGGFDPQFRQAGDDVDICWRLLDADIRIGYAPAALVWHHRRNSVKAFFKQQQGYGRSEAMLLRKHYHRFNKLGFSQWKGIIYGEGAVGLLTVPPAVFHGRQGSGLFQTIYRRGEYSAFAYFTLLEWHAVAIGSLLLSPLLPVLAVLAGVMWLLTACAIHRSVALSPVPRKGPWWCRPLVQMLHLLQPVVRAAARYRHRIAMRRLPDLPSSAGGAAWSKRVNILTRDLYWRGRDGRGREQLLAACERLSLKMGWAGIFHDEWQPWDLVLFGDLWHSLRLRSATEQLGEARGFTRVRCQARATSFTRTIAIGLVSAFLIAAATLYLWAAVVVSALAAALLVRLQLSRARCFAAAAVLLGRAGKEAGLEPYAAALARAAWVSPKRSVVNPAPIDLPERVRAPEPAEHDAAQPA